MASSRLKVCVCSAQIPFATGGTEMLADSLVAELRNRGHVSEIVRLPLQTQPHEELLKSCLAWRLINLDFVELENIDLVIATRFPSYMVRQQNKVIWLVHQYRQIYDLYDTPYTSFQPISKDNEIRKYLIDLDMEAFREAKKIFTISQTVADRLRRYNGIEAEVLFPPVSDSAVFRFEALDNYVLSVARLAGNKRVHLLIEAMQHVAPEFHAVVIGDGYERAELEQRVARLGLSRRVHFLGHVARGDVIAHYAKAGAVFYGPKDEDYGFATLEAFYARKPVITCSDSGGVLEFVDDSSGWIPPAEPEAIARCIDQALRNKQQSREKGEEGYSKVAPIEWNYVLDRLL
jgi:glycosyltransferase involved in cell wall biosynthesis